MALLIGAALALATAFPAVPAGAPGRSKPAAPRPKAAERLDVAPTAAATATATDHLAEGEKAVIRPDATLALEVHVPKTGATDGWLRRYVADPAAYRRARGRPLPRPGQLLRMPLTSLSEDYRVRVVRALFPASAPRGGDWVHRVGDGRMAPGQETIGRIAAWYTGTPRNATALEARNHLAPTGARDGQEIVIPRSLLLPGFLRRAGTPPAAATTEAAAPLPQATTATVTQDASSAPPILPPLPDPPAGSAPASGAAAGHAAPVGMAAAPAAVTAPDGGSAPGTDDPGTPDAGVSGAGDAADGESANGDTATTPSEDDFTEAAPGGAEEEEGPTIGPPAPYAPPPAAEGAGDLKYGRDREGPYATYRLKKGEALYSAVVIRYTGRVDVQEVNELAGKVARRSGITKVTGIPVGFPVKIPLDDLLPEYLPRDDPRRQDWERSHAAVERYTNAAGRQDLDGVAVILDAGHGGRDIGASHNGVWEHDYVYDVLCRIKALLETKTKARVMPTIKDRKEGYAIHDSTRLKRSQAEVLLTSPPFALSGSVPSVNLRWYLSNAWYRRLVGEGFDPGTIVFTSLHADARHPSVRGAMVYVPGAEYRRGRYGSAGSVYARYKEARQEPFVTFTREERERSEGLSRQFAASLVDAFADGDVAVHPYIPVRERIIRRGRSWVPAVLRCNIVPVQVLVEISNLSNTEDARALASPAYRQKVAEAYVEGLVRYFSAPAAGRPAMTAGAGSRSR